MNNNEKTPENISSYIDDYLRMTIRKIQTDHPNFTYKEIVTEVLCTGVTDHLFLDLHFEISQIKKILGEKQ